jgi:guanylate cyclase soluble subunit beta
MGLLISKHGKPTWERVARRAGISDEHLVTLRAYDDEVVYNLVLAAAKELHVSAEEMLEQFGVFLIEENSANHSGYLLSAYGTSNFELLENVNLLHSSVSSTFTKFTPPHFEMKKHSPELAELACFSKRTGLTPFVRGLVLGIADMFQESVEIVEETPLDGEQGETSRFLLKAHNPQ